MPKCRHCGKEFSLPVWKIHRELCGKTDEQPDQEANQQENVDSVDKSNAINDKQPDQEQPKPEEIDYSQMSEDDIRGLAKEKGIAHYWVKSVETLIEDLKE